MPISFHLTPRLNMTSNCINLFALHYFLWFSALTSIYGYISVYAKHYANATSSQYGLLNMILPFVTIGSKLFFCSLADRHKAYRSFFALFLITALIGYGSFGVLPFFVQTQPESQGLVYGTWALICVMLSIATISMSVISCLSDAFAMNSSRKNNISYGQIRLWGTIGWGLSSFVISFINQSKALPYLVPGLIMTIVLITIDILAVCFWTNKDDFKLDRSCQDTDIDDVVTVLQSRSNDPSAAIRVNTNTNNYAIQQYGSAELIGSNPFKKAPLAIQTTANKQQQQPNDRLIRDLTSISTQWILFKEVAARRRSIFRYMILFIISGALISLQWSYFFLYLEQIHKNDFSFTSGLSMVGQSMLGELPFFLLSDYVVKWLGRSHTLSISIMSIGVRYLLYEYLLPDVSIYFVLLTETFQGPSFGLFYVVLTEVGLDYSDCEDAIASLIEKGMVENNADQIQRLRQALRATMQSLMGACYEGLGLGIGSIVGGLVIEYYGFSTLWIYAAFTAIFLGSMNIIVEIVSIPMLVDKKPRNLVGTLTLHTQNS